MPEIRIAPMPCLRGFTGFISFLLCSALLADEMNVYVDKGACPGEGCEYCALYVAKSAVPVYENASIGSKKLGIIPVADTFIARTGEVHAVPTRFEVHREHNGVRPEDEVFALTYVGEGYFRIFLNGELRTADLGFSPWGGSGGKTCDNPAYCWGRLVRELEYTWWMWVVAESGLTGWVIADESMVQIDGRSH